MPIICHDERLIITFEFVFKNMFVILGSICDLLKRKVIILKFGLL